MTGDRGRKPGSRSFEYVRRYYGVPAKRGMRVVVDGKPGRITSGAGHYIRVLVDGERRSSLWHPIWRVEYEPDAPGTGADQRTSTAAVVGPGPT